MSACTQAGLSQLMIENVNRGDQWQGRGKGLERGEEASQDHTFSLQVLTVIHLTCGRTEKFLLPFLL